MYISDFCPWSGSYNDRFFFLNAFFHFFCPWSMVQAFYNSKSMDNSGVPVHHTQKTWKKFSAHFMRPSLVCRHFDQQIRKFSDDGSWVGCMRQCSAAFIEVFLTKHGLSFSRRYYHGLSYPITYYRGENFRLLHKVVFF